MKFLIHIGLSFFFYVSVYAQTVSDDSKLKFCLADSTSLILYRSINNPSGYYHLPANFRVATMNGKGQFSFLSYDSNNDGKIDGAIMHLLLTWGLTAVQRTEAEELLRQQVDSTAMILGALQVDPARNENWRIVSPTNSNLSVLLNNGIESTSNIPTISGSKWVAAFKFDGADAIKLKEYLTKPEKLHNVVIQFDYNYKVLCKQGFTRNNKTMKLQLQASLFDLLGKFN